MSETPLDPATASAISRPEPSRVPISYDHLAEKARERWGLTTEQACEILLADARFETDDPPLTPFQTSLIRFGLASMASNLDLPAMRESGHELLRLGAEPEQVVEVLLLVASLGMHSLQEGLRVLADDFDQDRALDETQEELRARFVGDSHYFQRFETFMPEFLDLLLKHSPAGYQGFFDFNAIPWTTGTLDTLTRELLYFTCDVSPSHRYLPGAAFHLDNCCRLGASRQQVEGALALGAAASSHRGIR